MSKLRLSLTVPGAVSLGAYEGGALAALLLTAQAAGEDELVIDSLGAASAGSITAVLTAKALLEAKDPVKLMRDAWVDGASFAALDRDRGHYPLSSAALTNLATSVLASVQATPVENAKPQQQPVHVSLSLTSLAGLSYKVAQPGAPDQAISVTTFQDWYNDKIDATADWAALCEVAIASGSNAMGFPAKRLDRSRDKDVYKAAGLQGLPPDDDFAFWYTDGGTTDNEPLGRTIDLAQDIARDGEDSDDDQRLYVLIHYDDGPNGKPPQPPWSPADTDPPPWVHAATRAAHAVTTQSIYDDLKRLQKVNTRLAWTAQVADLLTKSIGEMTTGTDGHVDAAREATVVKTLTDALHDIRDAKDQIATEVGKSDGARAHARAAVPMDVSGLVRSLLEEASGLNGRSQVDVELVSPAIDPADEQICAGAFLFHFGGFFDVDLREHDFDLGFRNMQKWITDRLAGRLSADAHARALALLTAQYAALPWRGDAPAPEPHTWSHFFDQVKLKAAVGNFAENLVSVVLYDVGHDGL